MICGNGLLAKGFDSILHKHTDVIFMCSGVSGSTTATPENCERERKLVDKSMRTDKTLVYTSSLSCFVGNYLYDKHKINMEQFVKESDNFLIVRVGNLVGANQSPWQFFPSIINQVKSGCVTVMNTRRDIIDLMDYVAFVDGLLGVGCRNLSTSFGSLYPPTVLEVVKYLETKFGNCEKIEVAGTKDYPQPDFLILNKDYYKKVIDLYETDYSLDYRCC